MNKLKNIFIYTVFSLVLIGTFFTTIKKTNKIENLNNTIATPISATTNYGNLSQNEVTQLEIMVKNKIGLEDFNFEYMDGFNDFNRFVLIEGVNSYLIYDRLIEDYLEFSSSSNSPYFEVSFDKLYISPGSYYYRNNKKIYNIINNEEVLNISELKQIDVNSKNQLLTRKNEATVKHNNSANSIQLQEALPPSCKVPYHEYFKNLRSNVGVNTNESCITVAMCMLLSYYDSIYNDNVIPEEFDSPVHQVFTDESQIGLASVITAGSDSIGFLESPGIINQFHLNMIDLAIDLGYATPTNYKYDEKYYCSVMSHYLFSRKIPFSYTQRDCWILDGSDTIPACKEFIRSGKPVLVRISGTSEISGANSINHLTVGYAYDENGIIVNFGWRDYRTEVNVNAYTIKYAGCFDLDLEPIGSNNYTYSLNGVRGIYNPLSKQAGTAIQTAHIDNIDDTTYNNTYTSILSGYTRKLYGFNVIDYGTLDFNINASKKIRAVLYNSDFEKIQDLNFTKEASVYKYHTEKIFDPGKYYVEYQMCDDSETANVTFTISHVHLYQDSYAYKNSTHHFAYCSCGASRLEGHVVSNKPTPGPKTCMLCGGRVDVGIVDHPSNSSLVKATTPNGSYILYNGIVFLADEDFEAYFNGTLVFNYNNYLETTAQYNSVQYISYDYKKLYEI